jgi:signal transduction histidine kinase
LETHAPACDPLQAAFDAALRRVHKSLASAAVRSDVTAVLVALRDAVNAHMTGTSTGVHGITSTELAARAVESVRLAFVEEVLATKGVDHERALQLLAALGKVQQCIATAAEGENTKRRGSLDLAVEIAHDMRSPLTAILFLIDMLRSGRSGAVTPVQARQLGIVYGAAFGLNQLATDLIDHVKGHDRSIERQIVPFSVTELLNSICDILAPVSEERALEIRIVTLPNDARLGYPTALHRILLNLATNAVKFTPKGAVTIIARQLKGTRVEFCVADSGPGISCYVQDQIFQPFRTAARTERQSFSSSGLGLSICQNLVQAIGGELRVSSTLGRGTKFTFVVDLPLAPTHS